MADRLLGLAAGLALFYLSVYPLLALQIYSETWYQVGCDWHGRCEQLPRLDADQAIEQLAGFWRHQNELSMAWTRKERNHLTEVRPIYDAMLGGFGLATVIALASFQRARLRRAALINGLIVLSLLAVLPFFKYFWVEIFHPLLFDNMDWNNNRADLSWYLMPKALFKLSIGALVAWTFSVNLAVWLWARRTPLGS